MKHTTLLRNVSLLVILPALLLLSACDTVDTDPSNDDPHLDAAVIAIETRDDQLLAEWSENDGWTDPAGGSIDELPVNVENEPLRAGGDHASLTVRYFDPDGSEVSMGTQGRDDETGERTCTQYSAQYRTSTYLDSEGDVASDIIADPPIAHPDSDNGQEQFAMRDTGEVVGIFHCDHIHFYPEQVGSEDVVFLLWHGDHADDSSDPITITVVDPDDDDDV